MSSSCKKLLVLTIHVKDSEAEIKEFLSQLATSTSFQDLEDVLQSLDLESRNEIRS